MKRAISLGIGAVALISFLGSAIAGEMLGRGVLHPMARQLTQPSIQANEFYKEQVGSRKTL